MSDARERIAHASRLVVKIGSSSLTNAEGGLHGEHLDELVGALVRNVRAGVQLVLVSSGSIAAGTPALGLRKPPRDLATQQAAANRTIPAVFQQKFTDRKLLYLATFKKGRQNTCGSPCSRADSGKCIYGIE